MSITLRDIVPATGSALRGSVVAFLILQLAACSASSGSGSGSGAASGSGASSSTGGTAAGGSGNASAGGATAGGDIGDPCSTNAECTVVPGSECFTTIGGGPVPTVTFPGGFCSKGCDGNSEQNECGDTAACASVSTAGGGMSTTLSICTPPCATNDECRVADGYHCQLLLPGIGFCAP